MLFVVLGGVLVAEGRADVEAAYYNSSLYYFDVTDVPDLDQCRAGLPGNGSQYCVPTSSMNWMAYFANHGLDSMAPGPGQWMNPARYDEMTNNIALMGQYMSTDPNDGTTGGGGRRPGLGHLAADVALCCLPLLHQFLVVS